MLLKVKLKRKTLTTNKCENRPTSEVANHKQQNIYMVEIFQSYGSPCQCKKKKYSRSRDL